MPDYPLPDYALAVWFNGTGISIRIPPQPGKERGHIITTTADVEGLKNLLTVLKERHKGSRAFGTSGAPTQQQFNAFRTEAIARAIAEAKARKDAKRKYGEAARDMAPSGPLTLKDLGI